jgi:type IV pilus assembly protein PilC
MISFQYSARDTASNQVVKGIVEAETESAAGRLLIKQGLSPISITIKGQGSSLFGSSFVNRVPAKARIIFSRQLSTLINAGLPLTQALRTVADQTDSKPLKIVVGKVINDVEGGKSLSQSFAKFPKVFNETYIALVAAGEVSGTLDEALERIASQQEKDAEIVRKVRGALIYPAIVVVVIIGVVVFMMTTVVPQVKQLYKDLGKTLPWYTSIMVNISDFLIHFWWIVIIILAAIIFFLSRFAKTDSGRAFFDGLKMNIPLFGNMFKKLYMARFCRTGQTLMKAGVPMLEMLNVSAKAVGNVHVASAIRRTSERVKGGKALSESLAKEEVILHLVPQMIGIGEKSGSIDAMMDKAAAYFENELDESIKAISTSIEPVLMVCLAAVAAFMVIAVLLPIYGLVGQNLAL